MGLISFLRFYCFFQRSKSISFREVLENASTDNRTVIVTTLNQAWAEPNSLFDLFLESFRIGQGTQKLLQHVVVVCLDSKAFDRCSQLHPNCYYLETKGTDFSGEKLFATPDYLKMMWRRIELLTQVLEMGYNFIFTVLSSSSISNFLPFYKSFESIFDQVINLEVIPRR